MLIAVKCPYNQLNLVFAWFLVKVFIIVSPGVHGYCATLLSLLLMNAQFLHWVVADLDLDVVNMFILIYAH